jgi:DNA-binding transcriptional LysR family regulator
MRAINPSDSPTELLAVDLNLLLSLRALLQERSVSRAAERVGIGQPAMSTQLARLRRHFGDELLTRSGNTYLLTPLATQLLDRVELAVSGVRRVFSAEPDFDPACSEREFRVAMSDYTVAVLGSALSILLDEQAPNVRLRIEPVNAGFLGSPAHVHRTVDALVLPHGYVNDLPHLDLYTDDWVCLVASDNHAIGEQLTLNHLAEHPWVVTYDWPSSPAIQQLRIQGVEPRARIVVDSFTAVPYLIAGTDRVALIYRRLADRLHIGSQLRILPCPFQADPIVETVWWHPMYEADPGHQWLRTMFLKAASEVAESSYAGLQPR